MGMVWRAARHSPSHSILVCPPPSFRCNVYPKDMCVTTPPPRRPLSSPPGLGERTHPARRWTVSRRRGQRRRRRRRPEDGQPLRVHHTLRTRPQRRRRIAAGAEPCRPLSPASPSICPVASVCSALPSPHTSLPPISTLPCPALPCPALPCPPLGLPPDHPHQQQLQGGLRPHEKAPHLGGPRPGGSLFNPYLIPISTLSNPRHRPSPRRTTARWWRPPARTPSTPTPRAAEAPGGSRGQGQTRRAGGTAKWPRGRPDGC